jgi:hypothetical protein
MQIARNENFDGRSFGMNSYLGSDLDYRLEALTRVWKTYIRLKPNIVIYTSANIVRATQRIVQKGDTVALNIPFGRT